jgi:hypothetical protein
MAQIFEQRAPNPLGIVAIAPIGAIALEAGVDAYIDLREASITQQIGSVQSLYLDCAAMVASVTAFSETTAQQVFWPAGGAGWQNLTTRDNPIFRLRSSSSGTVRAAVSANPIPSAMHLSGSPASNSQTAVSSNYTNVLSAVTSTQILASNSRRVDACFFNDSTADLYLMLSSVAATSLQFSYLIPPQGFFTLPTNYLGVINGAWASASGGVRVTEFIR